MKTGAPRALFVLALLLAALGVAAAAAAVAIPQRTVMSLPQSAPTDPAPSASTPAPRSDDAEESTSELSEDSVAYLADPDWVTETAETVGIPQRVLAAYAGAALELAETFPQCNIGWSTLAGIGYVESEHGTMGGSQVDSEGITRPDIIGPALDGEDEDVAEIRDTDAGELDGDVVWDRAVGPMQFVPSTWGAFGRDGSGDGEADVHNIDDAALSAGAYLCATGGDLSERANWIRAVSAYNDSVEYNNDVADAADHYATVR